jgi:hypothetical protein
MIKKIKYIDYKVRQLKIFSNLVPSTLILEIFTILKYFNFSNFKKHITEVFIFPLKDDFSIHI